MSPDAVTHNKTGWALFLDVDGTLLEIAATPQEVRASDRLKRLLKELSGKLDGALALVSGRGLADLDALFAPHRFAAAGVHGVERRDAEGRLHYPDFEPTRLDAARERLRAFVRGREGLLLEDKGHGLAVHFRRAPQHAPLVLDEIATVLAALGPDFLLQRGKCVFEIRARGYNKGTAIAAFMREPPFRGRTPVFAGDDVTDEDAFGVVNELGGLSIRVGAAGATQAQRRMRSVADVHDWLEALTSSDGVPAEDRR